MSIHSGRMLMLIGGAVRPISALSAMALTASLATNASSRQLAANAGTKKNRGRVCPNRSTIRPRGPAVIAPSPADRPTARPATATLSEIPSTWK